MIASIEDLKIDYMDSVPAEAVKVCSDRFDAAIRKIRADAWDEAWQVGFDDATINASKRWTKNPYRTTD